MFRTAVERLIQEAMREGKFEDLRGEGRPVDLRAYFETPAEVRVAYAVLQSAGLVPREVELLREIAETGLTPSPEFGDKNESDRRRRIQHLRLELDLLAERNKSAGCRE